MKRRRRLDCYRSRERRTGGGGGWDPARGGDHGWAVRFGMPTRVVCLNN